jgi:hypothetical protein
MSFDAFELQEGDDGEYHNAYLEFMQQHGTFDESFVQKKKEKKKPKTVSLDQFINDGNDYGEKSDTGLTE